MQVTNMTINKPYSSIQFKKNI